MADIASLTHQAHEFSTASIFASDLEMAFQLQLNEALAASTGHTYDPETIFLSSGMEGNSMDRSVALQLQNLELTRQVQEMVDLDTAVEVAAKTAKKLAVEMKRWAHDREFARSIEEMSEDEWEEDGDYFEKPFVSKDEEFDCNQLCKLYFGKTRVDPGNVATAWALTDAEGNVLFQQSKYIGLSVSAGVAEYTALLDGLAYARVAGIKHIEACGNSSAIAFQVSGKWKARNKTQVELLEEVKVHVKALEDFSVVCVPKGKNEYVLDLAKQAIDRYVASLGTGESSKKTLSQGEVATTRDDCPICCEKTDLPKMFTAENCSHKFCSTCLSSHVEVQVKQNQVPVRCPVNCLKHLTADECQPFLSSKLFETYSKRLVEVSIPESERVYCPFPNCSALMSKGDIVVPSQGSSSRNPHKTYASCTECMECHRLFCVECHVPWHSGYSCAAYQQLPPDMRDAEDNKLYQLAKNQSWQRCKKCRRMIELAEGCFHMTCRCGHEFCYTCGAEWTNKQPTCKCKLWDEHNILRDDDDDDDDDDNDDDDEEDNIDRVVFGGHIQNHGMLFNYKTRICRYWEMGYCLAGENCNFAHGEDDLCESRW